MTRCRLNDLTATDAVHHHRLVQRAQRSGALPGVAAPPGARRRPTKSSSWTTPRRDGSAEAARRWTDVQVIEPGGNLGFARGTNVGIRASRGDLLLLLNSDTIVPPGAIDRLVEEIERDAPHRRSSVPGSSTARAAAELSFGSMMGPFNELRQKLLVRGHAARVPMLSALVERMTSRARCPDWVSGACLLVRRADAEAVGLLDERYFMYAEDVDFCAAIRARGGRIRFAPAVTVVHARGRSAAAAPSRDATPRTAGASSPSTRSITRAGLPLLRWYLRLRGASPNPQPDPALNSR